MYNVAFFFHILGVLAFVAGIVVAGVAFESARRRELPAEVATLLGLSRIGVLLVGTGTLLAGGFGLWLVHLGKWHYGSFWVSGSIALFVVALALGAIGGQRPKRARRLAAELASAGAPLNPELRALLNDRAALAQNYVSLLLVLAIVVLMCFKP
jgi:uncharacterized membrane protein